MHAGLRWCLVSVPLLALAGCALTPPEGEPSDPLEPINRAIYRFNDTVDRAVIKPLAKGYEKVLPAPARTGVGNFFRNLKEPLVVVNDLLQAKPNQALADTSRFVFNSTFGVAGIFDIASLMQLPRHEEDFGQTFGRWGFGEGWYLVLPFLGPSTARDTLGLVGDIAMDPLLYYDEIAARNVLAGIRAVDRRSQLLAATRVLETAALDPYLFTRDAFRQRRWNLIHDGNPPPPAQAPGSDDAGAPATQRPGTPAP